MGQRIYPDYSNGDFDIKYARRKLFGSDIRRMIKTNPRLSQLVETNTDIPGGGGTTTGDIPPEIIPAPPATVAACCKYLVLVDRFRVNAETATTPESAYYTSAALAYQNFVVYSNGVPIEQTNNSLVRNVQKVYSDTTIVFNGGWTENEVIEIYILFEPMMNGLVDMFVVGATGASMNEGDTAYVNAGLEGYNYIMFSNKIAIHQMDDIVGERYSTKPKTGAGSDTITVNGGVYAGELIEIYKVF